MREIPATHAAVTRSTEKKRARKIVFPHNEPAIQLYEEFGFRREGYRERHYRRDGDLIDAVLMAYEVMPRLEK